MLSTLLMNLLILSDLLFFFAVNVLDRLFHRKTYTRNGQMSIYSFHINVQTFFNSFMLLFLG